MSHKRVYKVPIMNQYILRDKLINEIYIMNVIDMFNGYIRKSLTAQTTDD